jgi:hypothetical protein
MVDAVNRWTEIRETVIFIMKGVAENAGPSALRYSRPEKLMATIRFIRRKSRKRKAMFLR